MPIVSTGQFTITDLNDGIRSELSKPAHVLPASAGGVVSTYTGSGTQIRVYQGGTELTYDGIGTANGTWRIASTTPTNITVGTITDSGTFATIGDHSVVADATDTSTIQYNISGRSLSGEAFTLSPTQTFSKARAGAPGANSVVIDLSNDNATVPANSDGSSPNFTGVSTTLSIFEGGTDTTASWAITQALSSGLTGTASGTPANRTFTPSGLTVDSGTVTFTATRAGYANQTIVFTISKAKAGTPGTSPTVYSITTSQATVKRLPSGSYSNSNLVVNLFSTTGSGAPTAYAGRFIIATSTDGTTYTDRYTSAVNESSTSYAIVAGANFIRISAYLAGGTTTLIDQEVIPVADDGAAGVNARAVSLTIGAQAFAYNAAGTTPSPTSTTATATAFNTSGTVNYEFVLDGTSVQNGTTNTYTYTPPAAFADMPDTLRVNIRENSTTSAILASDTIAISGLRNSSNGIDALTPILSNAAHTLPTATNGTITYTGSGTNISLFEGTTELVYDGVGTANGSWKVVATGTNITPGGLTDGGNFVTVAAHSAMTATTASVSYNITGKRAGGGAINITVVQTLSRAIQGATGDPGVRGSKQFFASGTSWSDSVADAAITAPNSPKVLLDQVTISGTNFSQTRYWNGSNWIQVSQVVDGNLLVNGTVGANALTAGTILANVFNVGSTNFQLDGAAQGAGKGALFVKNGTTNMLTAGYLDANTIGIHLRDAAGNTVMQSSAPAGTTTVTNTFSPAISNSNITVNGSGQLTGIGSGNETTVANSQITISAANGQISGIGTGSGQSVANNRDSNIRDLGGALSVNNASSVSGAIKIRLPQSWTNTMMKFTVDIYEYAAGFMCTMEIGGYNYAGDVGTGPHWVNVTARVMGGSNVEYPVYYGHDGTRCCIWIGSHTETWSYPQVIARDFLGGHSNSSRDQWATGWSITFDTTVLGAISSGSAYSADKYNASVTDTLPGADWSKTSKRPGNLSVLTGTEGIQNSLITVNGSGQLTGIGTGENTVVQNTLIQVDANGNFVNTGATGNGTSISNTLVAKRLVSRGSVAAIIEGNTIRRASGNNDYASFVTGDPVTGACFAEAVIAGGGYTMIAFDTASSSGNYADQDFVIHASATAGTAVYRNGTYLGSVGSVTAGHLLRIVYDGERFQIFVNGSQVGPDYDAPSGQTLFPIFNAYNGPGSYTGLNYGPYSINSAETTLLVGNSAGPALRLIGSNTVVRDAGTGAWTSHCYSSQGYEGGAFCSFTPTESSCYFMAGLNTDPTEDTSYTSIDYAFYMYGATEIRIYESSSGITAPDGTSSFGTWAAGTVLSVIYDNEYVRYLINGDEVRCVRAEPRRKFFFDSSIHSGGPISNIRFGPVTPEASNVDFIHSNNIQSQRGNSVYKNSKGINNTWNAKSVSRQMQRGNAVVSGRLIDQGTFIGLHAYGNTGAHFDSLAYSFHRSTDGTWYIYESGTFISNFTAPGGLTLTSDTEFRIEYDGVRIRYWANTTLVREVTAGILPDVTYQAGVAIYSINSRVTNIQFGAYTDNAWASIGGTGRPADNATSDIRLVGTGTGILISGNSITRPTGGGSWDSQAYTPDGYVGGAFCSFRPTSTSAHFMAGLNTDPTADASYVSLDYCFYMPGNTNLYIYESANDRGMVSTANADDVLSIIYDNEYIRYLKNGIELRSVYVGAGKKYHFDSSIVQTGLNNVRFGPYSAANAPLSFINANGQNSNGNSVFKSSGTSGWNSKSISAEVQKGTAVITWKMTGPDAMVGLHQVGNTNPDYGSLYASIYRSGGGAYVYESGGNGSSLGSVNDDTVYRISYDGTKIEYFINNSLVRTLNSVPSDLSFQAGVAIYHTTTGSSVTNIQFGAYTDRAWSNIAGSGRPEDYATGSENLIVNGLMADSAKNWQLHAGTTVTTHGLGNPAPFSLRLPINTSSYNYPNNGSYITINGATKFFVSGWSYKADAGGPAYIGIEWYYADNSSAAGTTWIDIPSTGVWTNFALQFTPPTSAAKCRMLIHGNNSTGDVYVGNILFSRSESGATVGAITGTNLRDQSGNPLRVENIRNNMALVDWWKREATIPWSGNGGAGNEMITMPHSSWPTLYAPGGIVDTVMLVREDTTGTESAGGWNSAPIAYLDPDKTYRFVVPILQPVDNNSASAYWGTDNVATLNTTTNVSNPYFAASASLTRGRWHLFIGYIFPRGSTNNTHDSAGIWDTVTGQKVATGTNYCFRSDGSQPIHRAYQYYAAPSVYQFIGRPLIECVDGTQSSLREYFTEGAVLNTYIETQIFVTQNTSATGNTIRKTGGTNSSWDSQAYSKNGFTNGAFCVFSPDQTAMNTMVGLNRSTDVSNNDYVSIDYAFYCNNGGDLRIYESGSDIGSVGTYAVGDLLSVTYDGSRVRYIKNGTILRTVAIEITAALHFDSSFYVTNTSISKVNFGPMSANNWASVGGANRPADNATVGAVIGSNLTGTFTETEVGNRFDANSIPSTYIKSLAADKITTGTLSASSSITVGATGSASIVLDGSKRQITVKDTAGAIRVKIGDLSV